MPAIVEVIIQGVAICYRKRIAEKEVWRILFPFDADCHKVKLSYQKGEDTTEHKLGEYGKSETKIEITTDPPTSEQIDSTDEFKVRVFDLTSPKTHKKIGKKDGWEKKSALLTIDGASFGVAELLKIHPKAGELDVVLTDRHEREIERIALPAYSIKGTINLGENRRIVVKANGKELLPDSKSGEKYTLTFNNDCVRPVSGRGDMEMFYDLIENPDAREERFFLTGKSKGAAPGKSKAGESALKPDTGGGVLYFAGDKPCLVVKATDTDRLLP